MMTDNTTLARQLRELACEGDTACHICGGVLGGPADCKAKMDLIRAAADALEEKEEEE